MRVLSLRRLIVIGMSTAAGGLLLSMSLTARHAQAQATVVATPRSTSTPLAGIPLTYTVKRGDTFNSIARQFDLTPEQLQALNAISDINIIDVGQVLIVGISPFTPTAESAQPLTSTPTATARRTSTPLPTRTFTAAPTVAPTRALSSFEQATPSPTTPAIVPAAPTSRAGIPLDVIVVGVLICLGFIGIIVGLRLQR